MALSDVLKKYAEEAREGIMKKIPQTDEGIVPYKTTSSSYPVYNLNSDTVEEKQTVNYEPVGIMAQPEGKPVGIDPPFMPDMELPIPMPDPSPKDEQPFVTGPTGVISYGTTEEGTPRLLTDYRTGETVYADTGEPYTPPPTQPVEPEEPEEPIVDPCPEGYQLVDGVCQPISQARSGRDEDEPFVDIRTNNQKGRDSLKNFGVKLTGGEDSIFADPEKTKAMFGESRELPTFTADDFETGIPNIGPLSVLANVLGKTFIAPSQIKNLEETGFIVKTGNKKNNKDEYTLSENGIRSIVQAGVDDDTPRMESELRKQGFTQEEIDSGKALAKMRGDDSDFYPDRPVTDAPNLSFGPIEIEELPPIDPSIDATDAVRETTEFGKDRIRQTRLRIEEAERKAEEAEKLRRREEAERQKREAERLRKEEAALREAERIKMLERQRQEEAKRKTEELEFQKRQLAFQRQQEELERRRKVERELAEKTQQEKEERRKRKEREKEQKDRLGYGENIDKDIIDANKRDSDREAQKQTGDPDMRAVTDRYGNPVRDSKGNVVTNPKPKKDKDSGGGGGSDDDGCVIATHGVSTGGFTLMEKAKAELWCKKTYHDKWYGEIFRKGYRAAGMKHINNGTAPKVYQEFKDFVAYGRGIKKDWKSAINYYYRTITFFITGLFIGDK